MKRGILVTTGVKERLLALRNPFEVLDQGGKIDLKEECFPSMFSMKWLIWPAI